MGGLYCLIHFMTKGQTRVQFLTEKGKEFAKDLTAKATRWELEFKAKLEKYGIKFIFQHPVICNKKNLFILDFYLPEYKLGIELDGYSHYTPAGMKKDNRRTSCLKKEGIKIIRLKNSLVEIITEKNFKMLLRPYV